jgi:hypothetical protein
MVGMMNCCGVFGAWRGYSLCMNKGRDAGNRQSEALWVEQGMKHRLDGEPMVTTMSQVRKAGPLANRAQRPNLEGKDSVTGRTVGCGRVSTLLRRSHLGRVDF